MADDNTQELSLEDKLKEKLLEGTTPEEIVEEVVEAVKKPEELSEEFTDSYLLQIARAFLEERRKRKKGDLIAKETEELKKELLDFKDFMINKIDNLTQEVNNLRFETIKENEQEDDLRGLEERALIKLLDVLDKM